MADSKRPVQSALSLQVVGQWYQAAAVAVATSGKLKTDGRRLTDLDAYATLTDTAKPRNSDRQREGPENELSDGGPGLDHHRKGGVSADGPFWVVLAPFGKGPSGSHPR